jgi:tetratricopeptide (TPR) repeat protein
MRPDLADNPVFLRYHEILKANPDSIVFVPLAEMLIMHGCYEEAITVCKKGLERNPNMVVGRVTLAKAYLAVGNYRRAAEEAEFALSLYPSHPAASKILESVRSRVGVSLRETVSKGEVVAVGEARKTSGQGISGQGTGHTETTLDTESGVHNEYKEVDPSIDPRWRTVTMAEILALQGNKEAAAKILRAIIADNPENKRAIEFLKGIETSS